ncbi:glycine-rich RNA-binding protein 4 isoform x1 [Anaeramoeba ignava]|uniref:Glycine-rich RNA-binding protein 4 isoform x1 n=1 Tax=Anaeramoeba ignava TaxID=1746090 RepID=A0A9Q0RBU6_ANAIG|nr:glycine-rich RNA-binding protein 4 isoform x1 [Anaeramoeba ignava]
MKSQKLKNQFEIENENQNQFEFENEFENENENENEKQKEKLPKSNFQNFGIAIKSLPENLTLTNMYKQFEEFNVIYCEMTMTERDKEINGTLFFNNSREVEKAKKLANKKYPNSKIETISNRKILIKFSNFKINSEKIKKTFGNFGKIQFIFSPEAKKRENKYAIIVYSSEEEALNALRYQQELFKVEQFIPEKHNKLIEKLTKKKQNSFKKEKRQLVQNLQKLTDENVKEMAKNFHLKITFEETPTYVTESSNTNRKIILFDGKFLPSITSTAQNILDNHRNNQPKIQLPPQAHISFIDPQNPESEWARLYFGKNYEKWRTKNKNLKPGQISIIKKLNATLDIFYHIVLPAKKDPKGEEIIEKACFNCLDEISRSLYQFVGVHLFTKVSPQSFNIRQVIPPIFNAVESFFNCDNSPNPNIIYLILPTIQQVNYRIGSKQKIRNFAIEQFKNRFESVFLDHIFKWQKHQNEFSEYDNDTQKFLNKEYNKKHGQTEVMIPTGFKSAIKYWIDFKNKSQINPSTKKQRSIKIIPNPNNPPQNQMTPTFIIIQGLPENIQKALQKL